MTDQEIEDEIQAKDLNAPRISMGSIEAEIASETYIQPQGTTVTICLLLFTNGYAVVGHSACVSTDNFDAELGEKIARQHAIDQCWSLFGFRLASEQMKE
jgi:hypothetical protein